ncbi:Uncharacterised protein [Eggerthella lenta]|uniref:Uncharacterized protein n=1 Tax=Eggerthella lenta TaxID=84112 RepID=A0A6N3E9B0_EGGLN|nr:hypothetical protein [Eggerthella lenta]
MAQEANSRKGKLGGLFDDLSIAQVVAGALAAVTSMLLASQIGIYGSAIGVGVGSVVSAVASQLYKKFLQRSADKLKEIHPGETLAMGSKGSAGSKDGASAGGGAGAAVGAGSVAGSHAAATAKLDAAETTALPKEAPRGRTPHADASLAGGTVVQRARAERQRKKKFKRGVVIVSIVSALLAVAVSAFVIDFVSAGQGVGAKTEPILPSRSQPVDDAPAASNGKDDSTGSSSPEESDASKDGAKDQGESQSDGKGSSGSGSGSGTDSGSNSGSGSGSSGDRGSSSSGSGSGSTDSNGSSGSNGSSDSGGGSGGGSGNLSDSGDGSSGSSGSGSGSTGAATGSGGAASSTAGSGAAGSSGAAQLAANPPAASVAS